MKKVVCLTKGCPEKRLHGRGLCQNCYHTAYLLVQQGKTTWDELIRKGLAKAPRVDSAAQRFKRQLAEAK